MVTIARVGNRFVLFAYGGAAMPNNDAWNQTVVCDLFMYSTVHGNHFVLYGCAMSSILLSGIVRTIRKPRSGYRPAMILVLCLLLSGL